VSVDAARIASLTKSGKRLQWPLIWSLVVAGVLLWGWHAHLERYISPGHGLGYALGITGGSMMLALLIYSARKRAPWLRWIGSIPSWFQIHMVLGVVGPVLVLFHANFSFGATNSNVALVCMLLVAGSGVVGRYIYTRLHANMDGHESTLEQLKAVGERLRAQSTSIAFLPGLLDAISRIEKRYMEPPSAPLARVLHLFTGGFRSLLARWLISREVDRAMQAARSQESRIVARHLERLGIVARRYAARRLEAGRRTAEFRLYAQLFSFWHVIHIPLFFMLLVAGIVHVVAVNIY
jgi:hypothetical protein